MSAAAPTRSGEGVDWGPWGPTCGELSSGRARAVDNQGYVGARPAMNHRQPLFMHRPSTASTDGETASDQRKQHSSTVSTEPVNTKRLDMDPISVNVWTRSDLGTTAARAVPGPVAEDDKFGTPAVRRSLRVAGCSPLATRTTGAPAGRGTVAAGVPAAVTAGGEHP